MNYLDFSKSCVKYADDLMSQYLVDKFNYLPSVARRTFAQYVQKLLAEAEYLEKFKLKKVPFKNGVGYTCDRALTHEEIQELVKQMPVTPFGTCASTNSDGTVNVTVNMMEGKVIDESTLINSLPDFEESGETLGDDLVFEQPVQAMTKEVKEAKKEYEEYHRNRTKDETYKSMSGMESVFEQTNRVAKEASKHMKNLGKIFKNTKLKTYEDVIEKKEDKDEDEDYSPFLW